MGIPSRAPAVERIFDGNRPGKLFRAADNPKQRALRLNLRVVVGRDFWGLRSGSGRCEQWTQKTPLPFEGKRGLLVEVVGVEPNNRILFIRYLR